MVIFLNPGSSGVTPSKNREIALSGVAPHEWFQSRFGFTLAFHLICFSTQIYLRQTDITSQGVVRSFLYIALFLMFNLAIVLLSVKMGFTDAIVSVCKEVWGNFVTILKAVF